MFSHAVVDFFSALVIPILSVLEGRASMSPAEGAMLIAAGSLSSGVIQPVVAIVGDKRDTRVLGTIGLLVAAGAVGMIGFAHSFWQLLLLQIISTAGVGAFHPPAAAVTGHLAGRHRASAISVFFAAGILGGSLGSFLAPRWVSGFGVESYLWGVLPAIATAVILAWATHGSAHRHSHAHASHRALPERERAARWNAVWVLYAVNALRFIVNMAMVQVLVRWSELYVLARSGVAGHITPEMKANLLTQQLRLEASTVNGPLQAAMGLGMGIFGLLIGWMIPHNRSKLAMIVTPCVGSIAVVLMPTMTSMWSAFAVTVLVGGAYAGTMPLSIAAAQRLLPHRTTLASGLMMGGAWSLAFIGPPVAQWIFQWTNGSLVAVGQVFAVVLFLSGLLIFLIPKRLLDQGETVLHARDAIAIPDSAGVAAE
ncbi:MAG: MFS transporter [Phycisphaerales bacterium]|nr:MFS transporter [Planctomycetota bacterium]